jgi:tetratricopeptide (TPR) repeat protein
MRENEMKDAPVLFDKARRHLRRLARRKGTNLSRLARAMGRNDGYISTADDLGLNRLEEALGHAEIPPRSFYNGVYVGPRTDPRLELLLARDSPHPPLHPFLRRIERALPELLTRSMDSDVAVPTYREKLSALEDLRFRDAEAALVALEVLAESLLETLIAAESPAARLLAALATALGTWAASQRMLGQRDLGGAMLAVAFGLARRSGDAWAEGTCYRRAAFLARDYGRPDLGLDWIDEAAACFVLAEESLDQLQLLGERATLLSDFGDYERSDRGFQAALRRLPASSYRHLAAAHHGLAHNALARDEPQKALRHLEDALACYRQPDYASAHTLWGLGEVELRLGRDAAGLKTLRRALDQLQAHGSQRDVAKVTFELAEHLARRGLRTELASLAENLRSWLPKIGRQRGLREVCGQLLATLQLSDFSLGALAAIRAELDKVAAPSKRKPR